MPPSSRHARRFAVTLIVPFPPAARRIAAAALPRQSQVVAGKAYSLRATGRPDALLAASRALVCKLLAF